MEKHQVLGVTVEVYLGKETSRVDDERKPAEPEKWYWHPENTFGAQDFLWSSGADSVQECLDNAHANLLHSGE